MGFGGNTDYRSEIRTGLTQANNPKSQLAQQSQSLSMQYLPQALQQMMNAGSFGQAQIGNANFGTIGRYGNYTPGAPPTANPQQPTQPLPPQWNPGTITGAGGPLNGRPLPPIDESLTARNIWNPNTTGMPRLNDPAIGPINGSNLDWSGVRAFNLNTNQYENPASLFGNSILSPGSGGTYQISPELMRNYRIETDSNAFSSNLPLPNNNIAGRYLSPIDEVPGSGGNQGSGFYLSSGNGTPSNPTLSSQGGIPNYGQVTAGPNLALIQNAFTPSSQQLDPLALAQLHQAVGTPQFNFLNPSQANPAANMNLLGQLGALQGNGMAALPNSNIPSAQIQQSNSQNINLNPSNLQQANAQQINQTPANLQQLAAQQINPGAANLQNIQAAQVNNPLANIQGANLSQVGNPVSVIQDTAYSNAIQQLLQNKQDRDVADLRARYGASGGTSRGTPAAYAEAQLKAESIPQIAAALGGIRQQEAGIDYNNRALMQAGLLQNAGMLNDANLQARGQDIGTLLQNVQNQMQAGQLNNAFNLEARGQDINTQGQNAANALTAGQANNTAQLQARQQNLDALLANANNALRATELNNNGLLQGRAQDLAAAQANQSANLQATQQNNQANLQARSQDVDIQKLLVDSILQNQNQGNQFLLGQRGQNADLLGRQAELNLQGANTANQYNLGMNQLLADSVFKQAGLQNDRSAQVLANQNQFLRNRNDYELANRGLDQEIQKFNADAVNKWGITQSLTNQQANSDQINRQMTGLQQIMSLLTGQILAGIPGGSANINLSNPQTGGGLGSTLGGLGSLLSALKGF